MRFVLLAALTVAVGFGLRERTRRRRDDLVPHGYAEPGPVDRVQPGDEVVTVARLPRSEVAVARGLLHSAGIPSALHPARPGPRDWNKPVRIQVRAADAADATALLRDVRGDLPG